MSTEPFIGEIKLFGFNFAPKGYALCNGAIMSIAQNTALFSLLGTVYGGNGQTTFGLPDLQGRAPIGQGQGQGLPAYTIGAKAGATSVTLTTANMPAHVHAVNGMVVKMGVFTGVGEDSSPNGNYPATAGSDLYAGSSTPNNFMGPAQVSGTTDVAGGNLPIGTLPPYLVMNYSIAIQGIFPSRN